MLREIKSKLEELFALAPANRTASANGSTIDTQGLSALLFIFSVGAVTTADGSNYFSLNIEDSDDGSSWSAYSTVKVVNAGGDANAVYAGSYGGNKRYARAVAAETGTAEVAMGCVAVGALQHQP